MFYGSFESHDICASHDHIQSSWKELVMYLVKTPRYRDCLTPSLFVPRHPLYCRAFTKPSDQGSYMRKTKLSHRCTCSRIIKFPTHMQLCMAFDVATGRKPDATAFSIIPTIMSTPHHEGMKISAEILRKPGNDTTRHHRIKSSDMLPNQLTIHHHPTPFA